MTDLNNVVIRVSPEQLLSTAGEVEEKIKKVEEAFRTLGCLVDESGRYWEGDGNLAFQRAYRKMKEEMLRVLNGFRENAENLKKIAGVYESNERSITEYNESLRVDMIV